VWLVCLLSYGVALLGFSPFVGFGYFPLVNIVGGVLLFYVIVLVYLYKQRREAYHLRGLLLAFDNC